MLPVVFGMIGLEMATAAAAEKHNRDQYGAVNLWMGGRGVGAGAGVASQMGGRTDTPYEWDAPSSVVANWNTGDVFGAEEEFGFKLFGIPIGRESRLEHLTGKIEKAEAKISELEASADLVSEPAELAGIATKIAKLEAKKDRWEEKKDRIESKMGALYEEFAGKDPDLVAAETLDAVAMLSEQVLDAAKKLKRRPRGKKAYSNLIRLVASFDQLVTIVDTVLRPAMSQYVTGATAPAYPAPMIPSVGLPSSSPPVHPVTFFGADDEEAVQDLEEAGEKAAKAATAYQDVRSRQPEDVKSMEEAFHDAGHKAGRDLMRMIMKKATE